MNLINKTETTTILLVNAGGDMPDRLSKSLDKNKHRILNTTSTQDAVAMLHEVSADMVIVGGADGQEAVARIRTSFPWLVVIAVVDSNIPASYETVTPSAHDYVSTRCSDQELSLRVKKALEHGRMRRELTSLRQQVAMSYGFDNIVGMSKTMVKLRETIRRVAPTDITILLTGPIGTGKELVAKVIHHHSPRRKGNFVTVDCASIPEPLFESELFGDSSAPGYHTGDGLLMEANGGTIFFDDVDRVPPSIQPKLMNFLKNYTLRPAGDPDTMKVDVRVISATSKNLEALVAEGCFSRELYYQLSVVPLTIPGLAKRAEDIEALTEYFLRRLAFDMDRPQFEITRPALDMLMSHPWPGNVRELENTLKRATALCRNNCVDADDILFIRSEADQDTEDEFVESPALARRTGLLDEGQRSIIFKALSQNNWNFTQTAQELGIGRTTLWRKVKKYNLKRETVTQ